MEVLHQAVHVVLLVLFIPAAGLALIGLLSPLLSAGNSKPPDSSPVLRRSALLALGAGLVLGVEWGLHRLI